jgi:hypothetical protein
MKQALERWFLDMVCAHWVLHYFFITSHEDSAPWFGQADIGISNTAKLKHGRHGPKATIARPATPSIHTYTYC